MTWDGVTGDRDTESYKHGVAGVRRKLTRAHVDDDISTERQRTGHQRNYIFHPAKCAIRVTQIDNSQPKQAKSYQFRSTCDPHSE